MKNLMHFLVIIAAAVALVIGVIYAIGAPPEKPDSMQNRTVTLSASEAEAVKGFEARLKDYALLREKVVATAEPLSDNATPEEIDKHRQQMRGMIETARAGAKQGDFFTPGMVALVKRVCAKEVSGSDGQQVKSTIMDENPGRLPSVGINDRYPDGVPVTTMPSELLEALPKLDEYLEYRFLGKRLVLVDASAGMVLDMTPEVLP
jgi:hypothetical protein